MELGNGLPDRAHHRQVIVAREGGMDPTLQAHLRRPPLPRLLAPADDLPVRHEVRRSTQIRRQPALRERAESAAEVADVRVLDVARDDVGDLVPADLASEPVGRGEDTIALAAAGAEEPDDLL